MSAAVPEPGAPVPLACPRCSGGLEPGAARWECRGCGRAYRAVLGIPDLRVPLGAAAVDQESDWQLARELADAYPQSSFRDLVERLWASPRSHESLFPEHVGLRLAQLADAPRRHARELGADGWLGALLAGRACARVLDLGCGAGGFAVPAACCFAHVVGVDLSLAWLVVCSKRLEEERVTARLVCACAEHLPFAPDAFDLVVSPDVIEHVADRDRALREAHRVARPGALVVCTTPNRFSLTAEPHCRVWGVGLLPRAWMSSYVRLRTGRDFHATYPLSLGDVRVLFGRTFPAGCRVLVPDVPAEEVARFHPAKRVVARLYNAVIRLAPVRAALLRLAPFFRVVAVKGSGQG